MKLPNKVTTYMESVISGFPIFLSVLKHKDMSVPELYSAVKRQTNDVGDFLVILDCLYALGKVDYTIETGMLHYVG